MPGCHEPLDELKQEKPHNYQGYTRRIGDKQVPYIVVGTGGMPPQPVTTATGQPADATHEVTYDAAMSSLGYLFVTAPAKQITVQFWQLGSQHTKPFDQLTIDLATHGSVISPPIDADARSCIRASYCCVTPIGLARICPSVCKTAHIVASVIIAMPT